MAEDPQRLDMGEEALMRYVDGALSPAECMAVEGYLANHPALAARVMTDLRLGRELRAAVIAQELGENAGLKQQAMRLDERLKLRQKSGFGRSFSQRAAMLALFIALGWIGHSAFNIVTAGDVVASVPVPDFVESEISAYSDGAASERFEGVSVADFVTARAQTGISLPPLPQGFRVKTIVILPSAYGPSLRVDMADNGGRTVTLHALRPGRFTVLPVTLYGQDRVQAAYWQLGDVAFALVTSDVNARQLGEQARKMRVALY